MTLPKISPLIRSALLAGTCLAGQPALSDTVWTMSSWAPATSTLSTDFLQGWTDEVARVTQGRVTVRILPAALGAPAQHYELARRGIADITWGNLTYEPERFKVMWFCELPLTGDGGEAASVALWRTFNTYLADLPVFDGTHMLAVSLFGGAQIHSARQPLATPEDFRNQKVRMGNPLQKTLLEAMGAVPVAAPATKAYELIDSGVIDASLHPVESVLGFGLAEALPYTTDVEGGFYDAMFFLTINDRAWQGIDAADRAAITAISGEVLSGGWGAFWDRENAAAREVLAASGHSFVTPDPALNDLIAQVRDEFLQDWIADGAQFDLPQAAEVAEFFQTTYTRLAGEAP
ncbi:MAG: TRAP transporter substrate-binding protein [Paracoccus sp. (in: a-proteobacteria)]|uniref:TRAP transporter substrate-binding protein n=1 Tax=Paracoccus sp. TaxID=267 RepID=UPI003918E0EC